MVGKPTTAMDTLYDAMTLNLLHGTKNILTSSYDKKVPIT